MRVAHCIHGLGLGGAQEIIRQIVAGGEEPVASGRGGFQYLVYSCEGGAFERRVAAAGATVRLLPRRLPKLDPLWVVALARAMRRDGVDVVHTHLFGDSLHGWLAARAAGRRPVVMTLHIGVEGLTRLQRAGYRWLLARADQTVACSDSVHRSYAAEGWPARRPLLTLRNGIAAPAPQTPPPTAAVLAELRRDLGLTASAARSPGVRVVASIGRLAEQKGHRHLIAAFGRLRAAGGADGAHLVLVGEGELRGELARRAREAGVSDRVIFAGFRADVARLLPACDVVAFPSLYEGLPVALLEAMAAARCVVAADLPGIAQAVRDGREALLVPPADAAALAGALARALADGELRRRLGAAAELRFRARYTASRMVAGYERLYREVAAAARELGAVPSGPAGRAAIVRRRGRAV
jgi:glycosyltransferase involved in cell wall biosynthesis